MNYAHAAGDRRREPDAILGAVDIVIHGFGDRHDRDAFVVQTQRIRKRIISADRNYCIQTQFVDDLQYVGRKILDLAVPLTTRQKGRDVFLAHLPRIGPRSVQYGAAGAINRPDRVVVEHHRVPGDACRIIWLTLQQAAPTTTDAQNVVPVVQNPADDGLEASVQSRDVTPTGQNSDSHTHSSLRSSLRPQRAALSCPPIGPGSTTWIPPAVAGACAGIDPADPTLPGRARVPPGGLRRQ